MAHKAARKSRQHGEMLTETTLNCRKLLENSLETNRLYWMTEMAALFSIALVCWSGSSSVLPSQQEALNALPECARISVPDRLACHSAISHPTSWLGTVSRARVRASQSAPASVPFQRSRHVRPNHSLKLTPHGLQNWPRSAYAHAAPRGQFHKPCGSA